MTQFLFRQFLNKNFYHKKFACFVLKTSPIFQEKEIKTLI
jgi:hypothetical protein